MTINIQNRIQKIRPLFYVLILIVGGALQAQDLKAKALLNEVTAKIKSYETTIYNSGHGMFVIPTHINTKKIHTK